MILLPSFITQLSGLGRNVRMKCAVPAEGKSPSRTEVNTLGKKWSVKSMAEEGRGGRRMNGNSSSCSFNFIDLVINNGNEP